VAPEVSVDLPSRPDSPAAARRALKGLEQALGRDLLARVQLVVTELVANSYRHANGAPVRVEVAVQSGGVRGEVTDTGPGFEQPRDPEVIQTVGWGLFLVERLCDRWGVAERGNAVWFEIDRK
jgi:anti-sigma regulatory factor (Ser/Thr protein kinase)